MSSVSSELKLEGKIFLVEKNQEGEITSKEELDGEICLKVLVAVLDDLSDYPLLKHIFEAADIRT